MIGNIEDYINYRIQRAYETLSDAAILVENKRWNSCANRIYYACFYVVNALLIKNGLEAKTHSGIRTLFFMNFIKTGMIEKDYGKLYSDLYDLRQEGDYSDMVSLEEENVIPMLKKAKIFIEVIEKIIKTN